MSVYSGFATRKQETTYNNFVFKLIQIFADEILNRRKLGIIPGMFIFYINVNNLLIIQFKDSLGL
jgi:hypothetical protein